MRDELSPGRTSAVLAMVVGVLTLLFGVAVRAYVASEQDSLLDQTGAVLLGALICALTLLVGVIGRPYHHRGVFLLTWMAAGVVVIVMVVVTLLNLDARSALAPAALEAAGGLALLMALTRWLEGSLVRRHSWPEVSGKAKSEVHHDHATSALVPASALVAKDELRLQAGDCVPVDGYLSSESGQLDDSPVMGPGPAVDKREGDPVFAGSKALEPIRVVVAGPWRDSWAAQRNERHDRLMAAQVRPDRHAKVGAAAVTLLAVAIAGFSISRADPLRLPDWLPTVAAVLLAGAAVAPGLGRMRSRLAFLHGLHEAGLVVSRERDLAELVRVQHWFVDPVLLAAPGPVEAVAFDDTRSDRVLAVAEALTREYGGPVHDSLKAAVDGQELNVLEGAALRHADGAYHGTVEGERWFLGTAERVKQTMNLAVDPAHRGALTFFEDRDQTPWLVGRDRDGIVGVVGVGIDIDPRARAGAKALSAQVMDSKPEAPMLAKQAGLTRAAKEPAARDASLVAEGSPQPKHGLRVRVMLPRPTHMLAESGSPRLMRPALAPLAHALPVLEAHRSAAPTRAWVITGLLLALVAVFALLWTLTPAMATILTLVTLVVAGGGAPVIPALPEP